MELSVFFAVLIVFGIIDYRSMKKEKLKKEILPYLILMVLAGTFAVFYLTNPHRESFTYLVIKLFKLKGY